MDNSPVPFGMGCGDLPASRSITGGHVAGLREGLMDGIYPTEVWDKFLRGLDVLALDPQS